MPEQQVISANFAALDSKRFPKEPSINVPVDFNIGSVDAALTLNRKTNGAVPQIHDDETPPPAPLSFFQGKFAGPGFNTIFRPSGPKNRENAAKNPALGSKFPIDINTEAIKKAGVLDDNILELNLTREAWSFSTPLGQVPNRGSEGQDDIVLLGVPYTQSVRDVTNPDNGTGDTSPGRPIHFEPGLFLHVPAVDKPQSGPTISRLASIPHGTTINATGLAPNPDVETPGPPIFPKINIIPTISPSGGQISTFPSLSFKPSDTARLPQDLTLFGKTGAITEESFKNPNLVLESFNAPLGKRIVSHYKFTIATSSATSAAAVATANGTVPAANTHVPGLASISFLDKPRTDTVTGPNADAIKVAATFWVSKVSYKIKVDPIKKGETKEIVPLDALPGATGPKFKIVADRDISKGGTITVFARHIQYSQNVALLFRALDWPHVSLASLIPQDAVLVPAADLSKLV